MAMAEAYFDWLIHLGLISQASKAQLWHKGLRKSEARLAVHIVTGVRTSGRPAEPCIAPLPNDRALYR